MNAGESSLGRLIAGVGGVLLILSLFLPWAEDGALDPNGWELWTMADVFFLIAGLVAISGAITGGRFGVFRPDVSLIGVTDLLGVVATMLLAWLVIFDFPEGASREIGVFLALISAIAIMGGAGDYRTLRGAPLFPSTDADERRAG
jgi:drug/metabolite transporter superfamily protein YnfA